MWRALYPVLTIAMPVVAGLELGYLYISGVIGTTTALVCIFAATAIAVTGVLMQGPDEELGPDTDVGR